jgi:putative ABC transport system permease protein
VLQNNVREALIDRHLAQQFFPVGNPLGAKIPYRKHSLTIVGVVDQARLYYVHQDSRPQLFVRVEDWSTEIDGLLSLSFVLRSQREPRTLVPDVRMAIRHIDPRLATVDLRTMDEIVDDALRQQRISAVLIAGFAVAALLLVAVGLFGIVSGSVTRRRHELGVRLAVGADHNRVLRLVLGEGARLVGMGALIGLPGIYVADGVLRGVLIGVSSLDPLTLLAAALSLAAVAMAACYLPARRVLRIEPMHALRQE